MKRIIKNKFSFDWILVIALFFLCFLGCIFIYSASNYVAEKDYGNKFFFLKKQLIGYLIGTIAFVLASLFDYKRLKKLSLSLFIISLVLLFLVLTPLGKEAYGAKRWIGFGGFTIQPSEITKLCFVIFISAYFSEDLLRIKTFKGLIPVLVAGGITCLLIIAAPNMSVTLCVGFIMMAMLFIGGAKIKHLALICLPIILIIPVLIALEPYRLKRFIAFIDPWASPKGEGYQLIQSFYALGAGGITGLGLGESRQKILYMPEPHNDFIFSIIGEELGLVGCFFIIGLFLFLIWRGIRVAMKAKDTYGKLLAVGITSIIAVQAIINIAVVTGSMPVTGVPMPFISYGGTSLVINLMAMGILLNISSQVDKNVM